MRSLNFVAVCPFVERRRQVAARADAELAVGGVQVRFDRRAGDEELLGDRRVRLPGGGETTDPQLRRGQLGRAAVRRRAGAAAGCAELRAGAGDERRGAAALSELK